MTALVEGELVLAPDVDIAPVRDFPDHVRERFGGAHDDYILSAIGSRLASQRIDTETAAFLERFRAPARLVEAVAAHATEFGGEPAATLSGVFGLVTSLVANRVLVAPGDAAAAPPPALSPGDVVDGWTVVTALTDLADTDVCQVTGPGAAVAVLKRVAADAPGYVRAALDREAAVLRVLADRAPGIAPGLRSVVAGADRPYLVMDWCDGRRLDRVAADRGLGLAARGAVAARLVAAYADLHEAGVLHGDVHAKNVLVTDAGRVRLLDFGGAVVDGDLAGLSRIGFVGAYEPEVAAVALAGGAVPPPTQAGEQYAVAGLAYLLVTSMPCLDLSFETDVALRQIAYDPPLAFAAHGVEWPAVEAVLRRALAKEPEQRFGTTRSFADALAAAAASPPERRAPRSPRAARHPLSEYALSSPLLARGIGRGPTASVFHGAAGVAYALLRVASREDDPLLLAAADAWTERALADHANDDAYEGLDLGLRSDAVGANALFHARPGVELVAALVRHGMGDAPGAAAAAGAFTATARAVAVAGDPAFATDATNGVASLLLGAAVLTPVLRGHPRAAALREAGDALAATALAELDRPAPPDGYLGLAHGRAGAAYAVLRWAETTGEHAPALRTHLDDLAAAGSTSGAQTRWPLRRGGDPSTGWPGWCHGAAGYVLLWTAAARAFDDDAYAGLAVRAGQHAAHPPGSTGPTLCCGTAGCALSLLELWRLTGDEVWRTRAVDLARGAYERSGALPNPHSLFQGRVGVALALAEVESAETATWPLCGPLR